MKWRAVCLVIAVVACGSGSEQSDNTRGVDDSTEAAVDASTNSADNAVPIEQPTAEEEAAPTDPTPQEGEDEEPDDEGGEEEESEDEKCDKACRDRAVAVYDKYIAAGVSEEDCSLSADVVYKDCKEACEGEGDFATPPDSGCTDDIGTHTVHNTASDPNEPWLNLRASSNSSSEVLAKMPDGTCLTVLSQNSRFWNVKVAGGSMDGTTGYAHKNYMKAAEQAPEPVEEPAEAAPAAAPEASQSGSTSSSTASAPAPAAVRTGRVMVRSKPNANARIYVDGAAQGSAPSTLILNEGSHRIKLVGKSGKEKTFNVRANPSSPTSICWNFKKSRNCGN
jgi:hypothetical protein